MNKTYCSYTASGFFFYSIIIYLMISYKKNNLKKIKELEIKELEIKKLKKNILNLLKYLIEFDSTN